MTELGLQQFVWFIEFLLFASLRVLLACLHVHPFRDWSVMLFGVDFMKRFLQQPVALHHTHTQQSCSSRVSPCCPWLPSTPKTHPQKNSTFDSQPSSAMHTLGSFLLLLYFFGSCGGLSHIEEATNYHQGHHHRLIHHYLYSFVAPLPQSSHACGYPVNKYCSLTQMRPKMLVEWKRFAMSAKMELSSSSIGGMYVKVKESGI